MKAIVALSGGMDSTTVLAKMINLGYSVECYAFTYGSKHNQYENIAAQKVAAYYDVPIHGAIDLSQITKWLQSNLLKSGEAIPEGHYNSESMRKTVVPGRNLMFISILAGIAESQGAACVSLGIHQGDHHIYPDCRKEFYLAAKRTVYLSSDGRIKLSAPFLGTDKTGIIKWGLAHQVPYHLTRTCYKDQELSCGKCGSCRERLEAFEINQIEDLIKYD